MKKGNKAIYFLLAFIFTFGSAGNIFAENASAKDDFYEYINGEKIKNSSLKEGEFLQSTFTIAKDELNERISEIIKECTENGYELPTDPDKRKIAVFLNNFNDTEERNDAGTLPLFKDG